MASEAERIDALEHKVESLQSRLDWALLSAQTLLRLVDVLANSDVLKKLGVIMDSDQEGYKVQHERLSRYVLKSIEESFVEQGIAEPPLSVDNG